MMSSLFTSILATSSLLLLLLVLLVEQQQQHQGVFALSPLYGDDRDPPHLSRKEATSPDGKLKVVADFDKKQYVILHTAGNDEEEEEKEAEQRKKKNEFPILTQVGFLESGADVPRVFIKHGSDDEDENGPVIAFPQSISASTISLTLDSETGELNEQQQKAGEEGAEEQEEDNEPNELKDEGVRVVWNFREGENQKSIFLRRQVKESDEAKRTSNAGGKKRPISVSAIAFSKNAKSSSSSQKLAAAFSVGFSGESEIVIFEYDTSSSSSSSSSGRGGGGGGKIIATLLPGSESRYITSLEFSALDDFLLTTSREGNPSVWDLESYKLHIRKLFGPFSYDVGSAFWNEDSSRIASGGLKRFSVWSFSHNDHQLEIAGGLSSGSGIEHHPALVTKLAFGNLLRNSSRKNIDNKKPKDKDNYHELLASVGMDKFEVGTKRGQVKLWEFRNYYGDKRELEPIDEELFNSKQAIQSVAFSPSGETLLIATGDGRIRFFDVADRVFNNRKSTSAQPARRMKSFRAVFDYLYSASFSGNGRWVVTGDGSSLVKVFKIEYGRVHTHPTKFAAEKSEGQQDENKQKENKQREQKQGEVSFVDGGKKILIKPIFGDEFSVDL